MTRRTTREQLEELNRKREQLKARERELKQRFSAEERKKRTRRLIECGAMIEKILGRPLVDNDKNNLYSFLQMQERNGNYFTKAMNKNSEAGSKTDEAEA
jgi:hypothetical protein